MEPKEPKGKFEPFPGYNEMPEEYKGNLSVTIYQDSKSGRYEARFIELEREKLAKAIEDQDQMERSLGFIVAAQFDRVSFAFLTAASNYAKSIPKTTRLRPGNISWQAIAKFAKE